MFLFAFALAAAVFAMLIVLNHQDPFA